MSSPLNRLIAMRAELDAIIAELGGSSAAAPKKRGPKKATASGADDKPDKPKRVISEEQKAKMKAGREAAKAKRDAEKAAGGAPASGADAAVTDAAEESGSDSE